MKRISIAALLFVGLAGCTDGDMAQLGGYGSTFRVTVYSGGVAVKTYTSTGQVSNEGQSDGWYFKDKDSGKFVRVAGTVSIEQID